MIPKITQDGPNIMPRYWCTNCGQSLPTRTLNGEKLCWKFCPECGRPIEWELAIPVKWEPMDCDQCGRTMIRENNGTMISTGEYVGTTTCRTCMTEHCSSTNCLGCQRGTYPDCKWLYLKRSYYPIIIFERHGDNDYSMWTTELPTELTYRMEYMGFAAVGNLQAVIEMIPLCCDAGGLRRAILLRKNDQYHLFTRGVGDDFLELHRNDGISVRGAWNEILQELLEQERSNEAGTD